jgi:hypothetical protein
VSHAPVAIRRPLMSAYCAAKSAASASTLGCDGPGGAVTVFSVDWYSLTAAMVNSVKEIVDRYQNNADLALAVYTALRL